MHRIAVSISTWHFARPERPMTYNVFGGTLNSIQPTNQLGKFVHLSPNFYTGCQKVQNLASEAPVSKRSKISDSSK